jgi:hypothetical protein
VEELLGDRHRRTIVRGVAEGWAADERDLLLRNGNGKDEADAVESELVRTHLPMLAEAGVIDWDRESGEVSRGPNFEDLVRFLATDGDDPPRGPFP